MYIYIYGLRIIKITKHISWISCIMLNIFSFLKFCIFWCIKFCKWQNFYVPEKRFVVYIFSVNSHVKNHVYLYWGFTNYIFSHIIIKTNKFGKRNTIIMYFLRDKGIDCVHKWEKRNHRTVSRKLADSLVVFNHLFDVIV